MPLFLFFTRKFQGNSKILHKNHFLTHKAIHQLAHLSFCIDIKSLNSIARKISNNHCDIYLVTDKSIELFRKNYFGWRILFSLSSDYSSFLIFKGRTYIKIQYNFKNKNSILSYFSILNEFLKCQS